MAKASPAPQSRLLYLGAVGLLILILAAYANHFQNGFHFDDGHTIVNNSAVRQLSNIPRFFEDASTFSSLPSNQSYRPLVSTLMAIDYRLGNGLHPFWFHLSIFTIFLLLTLLLAFVVFHLLVSEKPSQNRPWIALLAAGWFALHPANADAVNYIIVSAEVIAAFGVIASFACYFAFPSRRKNFLFVLPAAIAILAKPTAAIFPVLFAAYRLIFRNGNRRRPQPVRFGELVPPFLLCGAPLWWVHVMTPATWSAGAISGRDYILTQPYVALLYFGKFFWPAGLSADYDLTPFTSPRDPRLWAGCLFIISLIAGALFAAVRPRLRGVGFGLLWFLIALLPTALFPLAEVMNDYRSFLPFAGLVIAVASGLTALVEDWFPEQASSKIATLGVALLFLGGNAFATRQRNKVWQNDETLWRDVVEKSPHNGRGLMGYGIQLLNKGDYEDALSYFHRALQFTPRYYELLVNLAIAENATGKTVLAEKHFQEALQLGPGYPDSYTYYARYLLQHGRTSEARPLLHRALELSPDDLTAQRLLQGAHPPAAENERIQGDDALRHGHLIEGIAHYEKALAIDPESTATLNNLAWVLSTAPNASDRNGVKALQLAEKATQLTQGRNPVFLRTLAAAYAENGRFNEAIGAASHGLELATATNNKVLAAKLTKEIARYRSQQPLH